MKKQVEFSFGDESIAKAYYSILVPSLFEPWAYQLVIDNRPWPDIICLKKILELVSSHFQRLK